MSNTEIIAEYMEKRAFILAKCAQTVVPVPNTKEPDKPANPVAGPPTKGVGFWAKLKGGAHSAGKWVDDNVLGGRLGQLSSAADTWQNAPDWLKWTLKNPWIVPVAAL